MTKQLGIYTIHSNGQVYSNKNNKFLKPCIDNRGYLRITLFLDGKPKTYKLHRLIAQLFIPQLEGKTQVNHINGVKQDNRVENLEWCTGSENTIHAVKNGLMQSNHLKKFVLDIENGVFYESATELAKLLGMNRITLMGRLNGSRKPMNKYIYV